MNDQTYACPVSGMVIHDITRAPYTSYQGKKYFFCCASCLDKFVENPEKYLNGSHSGGCCHSH